MNKLYDEMRMTLLKEYKIRNNNSSFDDFLFSNHLFYLLPESFSPKVKGILFFNKTINQLQKQYICLLNEFASKNEISIIFVKGVILASQLYDNPNLRLSSDIDIFVKEKDMQIIENFLINDGFVKEIDDTGFHSSFIKQEGKSAIIIEVHNNLFVLSAEAFSLIKSLPIPQIKKRNIVYNNQQVCVLDYTFEFLYLFIHILRHFIDSTIHNRLYILSKYPISRILELVIYIYKFHDEIDWEYINNYLNKLHIGTLINNFLNIFKSFISFNIKIDADDSVEVFKNTTFFEIYSIISNLPFFDYIFLDPNQLWSKAVLIRNSRKENLIFKGQKYELKLQTQNHIFTNLSNYTVSTDIINNELVFNFYYPSSQKFEKRHKLLWKSDTVEIILFNMNTNKETIYHRFFIFKDNKNSIEIYEDDYRKYLRGSFYNESLLNKGVKGYFYKYENENCISIFINPKEFNIKIEKLLFDIAININNKNEYIKLSLSEDNPENYLLPFNYARIAN